MGGLPTEGAAGMSESSSDLNSEDAQEESTFLSRLMSNLLGWHVPGSFEFRPRLEHLIQVIAIVTAGLYLIGLITVNVYLFRMGITDFEILRFRYILTGAMIVGVIVIMLLLIALVSLGIRETILRLNNEGDDYSAARRRAIKAQMGIVVLLLISGLYLAYHHYVSFNLPFFDALIWFVFAPLGGTFILVWLLMEALPEGSRKRPGITGSIIGSFVTSLFMLGVTVDFVANTIYASVPQQFGGGRPQTVQILVNPNMAQSVSQLLPSIFHSSPQPGQSEPVDLIWENDDYYIVRDQDEDPSNLIYIQRNSVIAIVGEPEINFSLLTVIDSFAPTPTPSPEAP